MDVRRSCAAFEKLSMEHLINTQEMPVYPLSLSIPEANIVEQVPEKTKKFAHIIPGKLSTYIFSDMASYYRDYQTSVFGRTCRKGGYDCMRHYEILGNGCIPWFEGLETYPSTVMTNFPKTTVLEAMESNTPEDYIPDLLEYTRTHLTTKASANYIFKTIDKTPRRVLFLGGDPSPDCTRDLLISGMKEVLGKGCAESVYVPHIYSDYGDMSSYYGKGFTYAKSVDPALKPDLVPVADVFNHAFDLIVYGSFHRGTPLWNEINNVYSKDEIVIVCGEDTHDLATCPAHRLSKKGYNVFIRELLDVDSH